MGRVVDENAAPVIGADVFHVPASAAHESLALSPEVSAAPLDLAALARGSSAPDGRFQFLAPREPQEADAATGTALLLVRHAGFALTALPCGLSSGDEAPFDAGTIVLRAGSTATARVLDESGAPVAGAVLQLALTDTLSSDPVPGRHALLRRELVGTSDAEGRVRIEGLPAGGSEFDCVHPDFVPAMLPAILNPGRTTDLGDIRLEQGGTIAGTVTDQDGQPLAGAAVLVRVTELSSRAPDEDPVLSNLIIHTFVRGAHDMRTVTDEHGDFHVGTLDHAQYSVFADLAGHEPVCVEHVPIGTEDVRLVLRREALLVLTIVDRATGAPLSGLHATAQRWRSAVGGQALSYGPYLPVLTGDEAGASGVSGEGLRHDAAGLLIVERPGVEGTQVSVSAPGHASANFVLPGVAPPDRHAQTLELDADITLRGRVLEPSGQPIAHARVLLVPPDSGATVQRAPRSAVSGDDGAFRVPGLFAGTWTAVASAGGRVDSMVQRVELPSGREPAPLEFVLERGGYLAGSLRTAAGGAPPPGLRVLVLAPSGAPVSVPVGSSFGSDTASSIGMDSEGRWTCTRALAPGEYRVSVIGPAHDGGAGAAKVLTTTTVQVVAGGNEPVSLTLAD